MNLQPDNWTPLHAAVHHGDVVSTEFLLDMGAKIVKDTKDRLPNQVNLWDALRDVKNQTYKVEYERSQQLVAEHSYRSTLCM